MKDSTMIGPKRWNIGTGDDLLALWWIIPVDCLLVILLYKGLWWWVSAK